METWPYVVYIARFSTQYYWLELIYESYVQLVYHVWYSDSLYLLELNFDLL